MTIILHVLGEVGLNLEFVEVVHVVLRGFCLLFALFLVVSLEEGRDVLLGSLVWAVELCPGVFTDCVVHALLQALATVHNLLELVDVAEGVVVLVDVNLGTSAELAGITLLEGCVAEADLIQGSVSDRLVIELYREICSLVVEKGACVLPDAREFTGVSFVLFE